MVKNMEDLQDQDEQHHERSKRNPQVTNRIVICVYQSRTEYHIVPRFLLKLAKSVQARATNFKKGPKPFLSNG